MYSLLLSRPFKKTFILVVALGTIVIIFPHTSLAYHGQEISISLDTALFIPRTVGGNHVNVLLNDHSLLNQQINSVMKVYLTNTTLIKTSSSPDGIIVNQTGLQRLATTI